MTNVKIDINSKVKLIKYIHKKIVRVYILDLIYLQIDHIKYPLNIKF